MSRNFYYDNIIGIEESDISYNEIIKSFPVVLEIYNKSNDNSILEEYSELLESYSEDDILYEGATHEYIKIARTYKKAYKSAMKEGSKAIKKGDKKLAKSSFKEALNACDNLEKEFDKVSNDNAFSVVTGAVANFFYNYALDIVLGCLLAVVGYTLYVIDFDAINRFEHLVKNWDKSNKAKSANLYRNNIEYGLKLMRKTAMQNYNKVQ